MRMTLRRAEQIATRLRNEGTREVSVGDYWSPWFENYQRALFVPLNKISISLTILSFTFLWMEQQVIAFSGRVSSHYPTAGNRKESNSGTSGWKSHIVDRLDEAVCPAELSGPHIIAPCPDKVVSSSPCSHYCP